MICRVLLSALSGLSARAQWTAGGHPRDPVIAQILGLSAGTDAGVTVDREAALGYAPVWRGVNLIGDTVAKLPLRVIRRVGPGKEWARTHPAYRLLRKRPNGEQTSFVFWKTRMLHQLLEGNGYAYIARNGRGDPVELLGLNADRTWPVREHGRLWYVARVGNEYRRLPPDDVLHFRGLSYDGLSGYSVLDVLRESLGLGIAARKFGSVFFKNGAKMSGVLMYPGAMDDTERANVRASWDKMTTGIDQKARVAILEEGVKFQPLSITPEEGQFLATREFEVRATVANILGLPPHKLGDSTRNSYNSLEQENQSYLDDCADPHLVNVEQECEIKLLREEELEQESHLIEFDRSVLVRADMTTRYAAYSTGLQGGWLSRNEIRSRENLNPIPGGDQYYRPLNVAVASDPEDDEPDDEPPVEDDEQEGDEQDRQLRAAELDLLSATVARAQTRLATHARKAARAPGNFQAALEAVLLDHRAAVREILQPAVGVLAAGRHQPVDEATAWLVGTVCDQAAADLLRAAADPAERPAAIDRFAADRQWPAEIASRWFDRFS